MNNQEFEIKYVNLVEKRNLLQWENYASNRNHDLNVINIMIYDFLQQSKGEIPFTGRKKDVFNKLYFKSIVENSLPVSTLRNKLDNWGNYEDDYVKSKTDIIEYRIELSKRMREDVCELISVRTAAAKELGFDSYPELIFYCEELDLSEVRKSVGLFLDKNMKEAFALVKKYNLSWKNWFRCLGEIGKYEVSYDIDPKLKIAEFLKEIGFGDLQKKMTFIVKKQNISGIALGISIPDDVRILMRPVDSLLSLKTLFHECGHALTYVLNGKKGLYTILTTSYDEIMAIIFEAIGIEIIMTNREKEKAREIKLLEAMRCSISFLFEMELWSNTEKAEVAYEKYYSILGMKPEDNVLWAIDSFRSIDPVYIQNYVLGEIFAEKATKKLKEMYGDNFIKWGTEMKKSFLIDGMERSFIEKYDEFISN